MSTSVFNFSLFAKGGPMMWVLLILGLLCLMLVIERTLYLHRGQIRSTAFIGGIKNILAKRRIVEALTVCEETPGPVAAVVKAALLHADDNADTMRYHVQEAAIVELPVLERRLGSIAAIAQVAPLVGLLGTVLGFIKAFTNLEAAGLYAHGSKLNEGIGQALICCAAGLAVAIPLHAGYNYLVSRVNNIVTDMGRAANEIVGIVTENGRARPA